MEAAEGRRQPKDGGSRRIWAGHLHEKPDKVLIPASYSLHIHDPAVQPLEKLFTLFIFFNFIFNIKIIAFKFIAN
jgi:hypothetical protein